MADPITDLTPTAPTRRPRWWYSADSKRGFCWSEVTGYDYKSVGASISTSTLYLYLSSGIFRLIGTEADQVYEQLLKR